jgi:glycosyltransferase involved in cell wall biosynthesis
MTILSILTPFVPSRLDKLTKLIAEVERQVGDLPIEHLYLGDNKRRSVGAKRNALLSIANGDYIAFVDDDDWIKTDYVDAILAGIEETRPDVLTFEQDAYFDGVHGRVEWRHGQANEEFDPSKVTKRGAWHPCVWRREVALLSKFSDVNWGEDWAWAEPLNRLSLRSTHIPLPLHEYHYSSELSEAKP